MTVLGNVISWAVICGLMWLAGMCLVATFVLADGVYALFAVLFAVLALTLSIGLVREGQR